MRSVFRETLKKRKRKGEAGSGVSGGGGAVTLVASALLMCFKKQ